MAFNGSGTFVRAHNWVTDKTNVVPVTASRMDTECDGFATGLSTCLTKDGQTTATARITYALGISSMDGSASSASYAHVSDLNTGLYFPSADQWGLTAGGVGTLTSTSTALVMTGAISVIGAMGVTGNFLVGSGAGTFDVVAATGNTTIDGTLAVGGVATLASTSITGAATVGTTLGVTGTTTTAAISATTIAGTTGTFSGAISGTTITGSGAVSGATAAGAMLASQAEQEAGTAADKLVTPSVQHFHPGAAKAWGKFAGATGTSSVTYNSSTARDNQGDYTVTIGNDFSSADYVVVLSVLGTACLIRVETQAAGNFTIKVRDITNTNDADPTQIYYACYGDL